MALSESDTAINELLLEDNAISQPTTHCVVFWSELKRPSNCWIHLQLAQTQTDSQLTTVTAPYLRASGSTQFRRTLPPTVNDFTFTDMSTLDNFIASLPARTPLRAPGDTCSICFDDFKLPVQLPCHGHHVFCRDCIRTWLQNSDQCPYCREVVIVRAPAPCPCIDCARRRLQTSMQNDPARWQGFTSDMRAVINRNINLTLRVNDLDQIRNDAVGLVARLTEALETDARDAEAARTENDGLRADLQRMQAEYDRARAVLQEISGAIVRLRGDLQ